MSISDWSSDVCSSDLLESVLANSQRLLTMHRIAVGVGQWARPFIAVVIADDFHRPRGKGGLKIVHHELAWREVERSEERRVGKSVSVRVDLGGRRIIKKKI